MARSTRATRAALERSAATAVADLLRGAGYTEDRINRAGQGVDADDPAFVRRLESADEPFATLVRLFRLGFAIRRRRLPPALARALDALTALDLVHVEGDDVSATVRLSPWRGLLVAHDGTLSALRPDHVMGPSAGGRTLADLTIRRPIGAALDVGTGAGLHALLAARHADRVIATDVNPRAVRLTRLNALLNGVPTVEARPGDLFEPVSGDRFELIVANPPFVISPDRDYLFRDSGLTRDGISRAVVRGAAQQLEEGAFAVVLCNWVQQGRDWLSPVRDWVDACGCDVLVLHFATDDALAYAARWNRGLRSNPRHYDAVVDRWLRHYREEGIDAIASGAVVLRRRSGAKHWYGSIHLPEPPGAHAGDQLLAIFRGHDFLEEHQDDATILQQVFRTPDGARLDQSVAGMSQSSESSSAFLIRAGGLGVRAEIDPQLIGILSRVNGDRPLWSVLDEVVASSERPAAEIRTSAIAMVRSLLSLGLLEQARRSVAEGAERSPVPTAQTR